MSTHAKTALLALALAAALSACGSTSTTTVTAKGEPPSTSTTKSAPSSTTTTTTQPPGASEGASTTPARTHTAPEPAFAEGEAKQGSRASAAAALLRARGYSPVEVAQYHEGQTLGVLVGRRAVGGAPAEQAFFFLDGRFLGTDTKEPSASLQVLSQNDTEVTLAYALYRNGDPLDSPSGGRAVDFQLNDGKLQAIGQIPPVAAASAPSRR